MRFLRPLDLLMTTAGIIFFTSSFDVFLSFHVGPNVRVAQFFMLLLLMAALVRNKAGLAFTFPLGGSCLILWWFVQLAFVPVAAMWQKSLGYCLWLGLDIALAFAMVNLFAGSRSTLHRMVNLYLYSFVFAACFGIVQFVLPLVGGPALLVQQWWTPGSVARANGFSYEPSYYATYLIMGIVTVGSLRRSGTSAYRGWKWTVSYWIMVLAVVLSSSRMGLLFVVLDAATAPMYSLWKVVRAPRLALFYRLSSVKIVALLLLICVAGLGAWEGLQWFRGNIATIEVLVGGTGLMGTGSYSVEERGDHLHDTLRVIQEHPLMGRSLGGITETIASFSGVRPTTFDEAKDYEGQSVFAEALAASGIPGSIPFFCFVAMTLVVPLKLARSCSLLSSAWLRALVRALIFEWTILQLNQNILRLYLWVHLAVLLTVFSGVKRETREADEANLRPFSKSAAELPA